jgi:hypothetical protein
MMPRESNCPVSGPFVGLVRVSNAEHDDRSQREIIEEFGRRHSPHASLLRIYTEPGRKRYELRKSPAIRELFDHAELGSFRWLVIDRQSRLGTKHARELYWLLNEFAERGVRVWAIAEQKDLSGLEAPTIYSTIAGSCAEVKEQQDRAGNTARGMLSRGRRGYFTGGDTPYGFDRTCHAPDGTLRFRAVKLGMERNPDFDPEQRASRANPRGVAIYRLVHAGGGVEVTRGRPGKGLLDYYDFAPSEDPAKLEAVRIVFRRYVEEAVSPAGIARALNRDCPDAAMRGRWTRSLVRSMLANPLYGGVRQYLGNRAAVYQSVDREGRYITRELDASGGPRTTVLPPEERVYVARPELAIVEPSLAEVARAKLAATDRQVSPRSDLYWLQPWLRCGCGGRMYGATSPGCRPQYRCQAHVGARAHGVASPCMPVRIAVECLESLVSRWLAERGDALARDLEDLRGPAPGQRQVAGAGYVARLGQIKEKLVECLRERVSAAELRRLMRGGLAALIEKHREISAAEQAAIQAEIDSIREEIRLQSRGLARFRPDSIAYEEIARGIEELEQRIHELRGRLVPFDEQVATVAEEARREMEETRAAHRHLEHRRHRRAAESLGRLLERIEVHGKPSGYGMGRMGMTVVERVVFVPRSGPPEEYPLEVRDRAAIIEAVVSFRRQGLSINAVARAMQEAGHLTVQGEPWGYGTVRGIIKRHAPELLGPRTAARMLPASPCDATSAARRSDKPNRPARGRAGSHAPRGRRGGSSPRSAPA